MPLPKKIKIREVGPREGFQSVQAVFPTAKKLRLIELLNATGVRDIEITSFVRPDLVPQMADAEEVVREYARQSGISYAATYLNEKGFLRAHATGRLDLAGWLITAPSDTFLSKNNNTTHRQLVAGVPVWASTFTGAGVSLHGLMVSTAFGCSYEGKVSVERVEAVVKDMVDAAKAVGAEFSEICLADTVGWAAPEGIRETVRRVRSVAPQSEISLHLHDTRGLGMANAYAGLLEGVTTFDASVGGIGGCPFAPGASGNIATEDLVFLAQELGIDTGISLDEYIEAARYAVDLIGSPAGKLLRSRDAA